MTQGSCKLTLHQVEKLRESLETFCAADDRNFNDKERVLQLTDELANALIVKLLKVERMLKSGTGISVQEEATSQDQPDKNDDNLLAALESYNEVNRLRMEATQRDGDLAALKHFRKRD